MAARRGIRGTRGAGDRLGMQITQLIGKRPVNYGGSGTRRGVSGSEKLLAASSSRRLLSRRAPGLAAALATGESAHAGLG